MTESRLRRNLMHTLRVMPLLLALFAAGCQRAQKQEPDIKALRHVEIAEEQAWSSKDLERALSFYADDATLMYPNMPAIVGKESIRKYMKPLFAEPSLRIQYQLDKVDVTATGDLGYTQGIQFCAMTDPKTGKPSRDSGRWFTVRKKQTDGSWKIIQDSGNLNLRLFSGK